MNDLNKISQDRIACAVEMQREHCPDLLESANRECLFYELSKLGYIVKREIAMPVVYKHVKLYHVYRMDLLVEDKLYFELKSVDCITDVHRAQLLTYLRLGNYKLAAILSDNNTKELINNYEPYIRTENPK